MDQMELSKFITKSMESQTWREKAARIMKAALDSVDPRLAVLQNFTLKNSTLIVNQNEYDLDSYNRVFLVGAGKAGQPMAEAVSEVLGPRLNQGKVIVKEGYRRPSELSKRIDIIEAGHPIPDIRGVNGTYEIIELLEGMQGDDLVVCVISGGGSALMVSPVMGVKLNDLQELTQELLASGATVNEINTLRKHLERAKGGQIARYAAPAKIVSLILSDVVGDPLEVIGSGPSVPDPTTYSDSLSILEQLGIRNKIPASINNHLLNGQDGKVPETPKPGELLFHGVNNLIIGSNRTAALAALRQAEKEGFSSLILTNYLQGEAHQAGQLLGTIIRQLASQNEPIPRPACIIVGGETTVTLHGDGQGGRNQELALGAVIELAGLTDVALMTLATDGGDGITDAAGAVVTGGTLDTAKSMNLDPESYLKRNDSYNFFNPLDDLIKTGPTMTNVNDLAFLFAF
jgi:hydroxypyruvate reductase